MSEGPDLLTSLPTMVARHMLGYIGDCQSLLRLERTCRKLRDLMRDGETWTESVICRKDVEFERTTSSYRERICILDTLRCVLSAQKSSHNIILDCFGGADGIRETISSLLERMAESYHPPNANPMTDQQYWAELREKTPAFRGDTIFYLVEVIQGYMTSRLSHINAVNIHFRGGQDDYPNIDMRAIRAFDLAVNCNADCVATRASISMNMATANNHCASLLDQTCYRWPDDNCPGIGLSDEERSKVAREMCYRAGIVKIDSEALDMVATEVHFLLAELAAFSFLRRVSHGMTERSRGLNYYAMTVPPYERGPVVTVLPAHVQDAAIRRGMDPLLGLGIFGKWGEWAPRTTGDDSDSINHEVQESLKAYKRPEDWESESDSSSESSLSTSSFYSSESESDCSSVLDMDVDLDDVGNNVDGFGSTGSGGEGGGGCIIS